MVVTKVWSFVIRGGHVRDTFSNLTEFPAIPTDFRTRFRCNYDGYQFQNYN